MAITTSTHFTGPEVTFSLHGESWITKQISHGEKPAIVIDEERRANKKLINVYAAVSTIYMIADLQHRLQNVDGLRQWHHAEQIAHLRRELAIHIERESKLLAQAFYDYIVLTTAGEARHAYDHAQKYWPAFPTNGVARSEVWEQAKRYDPESLLHALQEIYASKWYDGSYGGASWGRIVEAGLLFKTTPSLVFLDHVVDLSHNSGLFLDKGVIFDPPDASYYKFFLDTKATGNLWEPDQFEWNLSPQIHDSVYESVKAAMQLLGLRQTIIKINDPPWEETKIKWGNKKFDLQIEDRGDDWDPENEQDEDPDEEEDESEEENESEMEEPVAVIDKSARTHQPV